MTIYSRNKGGSMAQAVRRSPTIAAVPSSRHSVFVLDQSVWVRRFFSEFLPFSPATNLTPLFLQAHLINLVLFHYIPLMVRQAWSAGILAIHSSLMKGLHRFSFLNPVPCRTRIEDIFIFETRSILRMNCTRNFLEIIWLYFLLFLCNI